MNRAIQPASNSRRRRLSRLCAAAIVVPVVTGAGIAYGDSPRPTNTASTDAAQELVVAGPAPILSLDPHGAEAVEDPTLFAGAQIFDTLVTIGAEGTEPSLALSWSNPDDLTWEFVLRDDVTFHDGSPLTAADVVASVERVVELEGPLAPLWASLGSIEAADDHTVTITTTEPFGGVLTSLSRTPITKTGTDDIGTGPFSVESFTSGETLVLVGNADYWGGAPALARIEVRNIPEVSSRVTALLNNEIDFTWALPPDQFPDVQDADGINFITAPSYQHYYAWLNAQRPPFDNPTVRQAVEHAIDWDSILEDLFPTIAERATAPIPPTVFGYGPNEPYAYDADLARSMLAEAGLADGFSTSMQFASTCCPLIQELAQAIASDLSEVGIDVELLEKETGVWVEDLLALDWDINLAFNVTTTGDANFTIGRLYTCAANRTGFCDDELDSLIATAQSTIDDAARTEAWAAAGTYIWDQAIGLFPFDVQANYAMSSSVQGFEPDPSGNPEFASVSIA